VPAYPVEQKYNLVITNVITCEHEPMKLKLRKVGNSVALIVPKSVRENMGVAEGSSVYLTETPDGYKISPYDPEFSQQMELARKVQQKHREALHELAK